MKDILKTLTSHPYNSFENFSNPKENVSIDKQRANKLLELVEWHI